MGHSELRVLGTEPLELWLSVVAGEGVSKTEKSVKIDSHNADSMRFPELFNHRKLRALRVTGTDGTSCRISVSHCRFRPPSTGSMIGF